MSVNLLGLIWRWRAQQKQDYAVRRAVNHAIKRTKAKERESNEKSMIRMRSQLREAEEQIRRLEIVVRDDRQFLAELSKGEAEAQRKKDLELCAKLVSKSTNEMNQLQQKLPAQDHSLINMVCMWKTKKIITTAAQNVDLDGTRHTCVDTRNLSLVFRLSLCYPHNVSTNVIADICRIPKARWTRMRP